MPLLWKIVTADLGINVLALFMVRGVDQEYMTEVMIASLLTTLVLNAGLVYWALLPLRGLEHTAYRVWHGDLDARVRTPRFADRNIARIGETLNHLLDNVTADRIRMRALASQVISAGDKERAHIARELHDSTAQSLGALDLMLAAVLRDAPAQDVATGRLRVMQQIVGETLAEVRTLSHSVHPRILDDLGLVAAIEAAARMAREQTGIDARVSADVRTPVPPEVASVLYRVAQEAMWNAVRHAEADSLLVAVGCDGGAASLEVVDDGCGFDVEATEARREGLGLFTMRERLALVDGVLAITSRAGAGTRVRAVVPLDAASAADAPPATTGRVSAGGGSGGSGGRGVA